jgi:hypothetical protein
MTKTYQIRIEWHRYSYQNYVAEIHVFLPISTENPPAICEEYVSTEKLFGCPLTPKWGRQHSFEYRSNYLSLSNESLQKLIAEVNSEVNGIKSLIHTVYVTNQDSKLPQDEVLEIDPRFIDMPSQSQSLSALDSWRHNLVKGDKIIVWSSQDEMLVQGWVNQVPQTSGMRFQIDLFESSDYTHPQVTLFVNAEDILPSYCDRRSDSWRFEFRVGDRIGWQDPKNPRITCVGTIIDIENYISRDILRVRLKCQDAWEEVSYMDIFEVTDP